MFRHDPMAIILLLLKVTLDKRGHSKQKKLTVIFVPDALKRISYTGVFEILFHKVIVRSIKA